MHGKSQLLYVNLNPVTLVTTCYFLASSYLIKILISLLTLNRYWSSDCMHQKEKFCKADWISKGGIVLHSGKTTLIFAVQHPLYIILMF